MTRYILYVVRVAALTLPLFTACEDSTESASTLADLCQIHLQGGFASTPVTVSVD